MWWALGGYLVGGVGAWRWIVGQEPLPFGEPEDAVGTGMEAAVLIGLWPLALALKTWAWWADQARKAAR